MEKKSDETVVGDTVMKHFKRIEGYDIYMEKTTRVCPHCGKKEKSVKTVRKYDDGREEITWSRVEPAGPFLGYYFDTHVKECPGEQAESRLKTGMEYNDIPETCIICSWHVACPGYSGYDYDYYLCCKLVELALEKKVASLPGFSPEVDFDATCKFFTDDTSTELDEKVKHLYSTYKKIKAERRTVKNDSR